MTTNDLTGLIEIVNNVLLPGDYDYTTASGLVQLKKGDRVRVGPSYTATHLGVVSGDVYEFLGADDTIVDLGAVNTYATDTTNWKRLNAGAAADAESYYPGIGNFLDSDARAIGVLIVLNDVRTDVDALITHATVNAGSVAVLAQADAMLKADAQVNVSASGGSFYGSGTVIAGSGQLVTNVVLGGATATLDDSAVTTGDLDVKAWSSSGIDATLLNATSSGDTAVGVTLVFNSIGWKARTSSSTPSTRSSATR